LSLNVYAYLADESSRMTILEGPAGRDSAGHERTRKELWGSASVVSLGACLLPLLATKDLYVSPAELDRLEADCLLVMDNAATVSEATDYGEEYIADRVGNIQAAIARARAANGWVVIW
jgi:hypothetical protein